MDNQASFYPQTYQQKWITYPVNVIYPQFVDNLWTKFSFSVYMHFFDFYFFFIFSRFFLCAQFGLSYPHPAYIPSCTPILCQLFLCLSTPGLTFFNFYPQNSTGFAHLIQKFPLRKFSFWVNITVGKNGFLEIILWTY